MSSADEKDKDLQTLQHLKNQRRSMMSVVNQKVWRRNSAKPVKPVDDLFIRGTPGLSNEAKMMQIQNADLMGGEHLAK